MPAMAIALPTAKRAVIGWRSSARPSTALGTIIRPIMTATIPEVRCRSAW